MWMRLMSKLIYFDFECPDGHTFEDLVDPEVREVTCKCGKQGVRQLTAVRIDWRVMGVDSDFPTAAAKWDRMQKEKARIDNPNLSHY